MTAVALAKDDGADALKKAVEEWWALQQTDWDTIVLAPDPTVVTNAGLWDDMPAVDSKAIARCAPIFAEHGYAFDVRSIRPGGYTSIGEAIADLIRKSKKSTKKAQAAKETV